MQLIELIGKLIETRRIENTWFTFSIECITRLEFREIRVLFTNDQYIRAFHYVAHSIRVLPLEENSSYIHIELKMRPETYSNPSDEQFRL